MNQQPDQLSKLLLEADGLLLLLHRHRDDTPIDAIKLLRKKLELILALTEGLDEEDLPAESESQAPTIAVQPNPAPDESLNEIHAEQTSDCSAPADQVYQEPHEIPESHEPPTTPEAIEAPEVIESVGDYIENTIEDPEPETSKPAFLDEPSQPIFIDTQNEPTVFFGDEPLQPVAQEPIEPVESTTYYQPEPAQYADETAAVTDEPQPVVVEQPVYHRTYIINESNETNEQHSPRRPISSVFNLNDKFRFRRELFGNSDAQYVECLDTLSVMSSIDEAREYLFDDLKWDPENEDVKAFVELLANYYR